MALAKRCDRCGDYYTNYGVSTPKKEGRVNSVVLRQTNEKGELERNVKLYELCPCCMVSLFNWLDVSNKTTKKED